MRMYSEILKWKSFAVQRPAENPNFIHREAELAFSHSLSGHTTSKEFVRVMTDSAMSSSETCPRASTSAPPPTMRRAESFRLRYFRALRITNHEITGRRLQSRHTPGPIRRGAFQRTYCALHVQRKGFHPASQYNGSHNDSAQYGASNAPLLRVAAADQTHSDVAADAHRAARLARRGFVRWAVAAQTARLAIEIARRTHA